MKKKKIDAFRRFVLSAPQTKYMPAWHDGLLHSDLLQRQMPYRVLLPTNYDFSTLNFSTLYLLHGLFGSFDNWTKLTRIEEFAARHQLIVVMPEGENGWYTDDPGEADKYESYLISELIPQVDSSMRTIDNANGRGIAGLSMGGYGAFKFALKFPRMFNFAASVSGAFDVTQWSDTSPTGAWGEFGPPINRIFGEAGSETRKANDIKRIIRGLQDAEAASLPFLYFDCGLDDDFIGANRRLALDLAKAGVRHEFLELPGGHDWKYWNERGKYLLEFAARQLSRPS